MEGMDSLLVLIGPNRIPDEPRQPTLVVEAQANRLELLREQASHCNNFSNFTWKQAVLASSPDLEVEWFYFNDARFDGILALKEWHSIYPNLQSAGQQTFTAITLADLLNDWSCALNNQQNIDLFISKGDPLQVLEGAGSWIQRIRRIKLESPRAAEVWEERCDTWLQQQGFRPEPNNSLSWILDQQTAKLIQQRADAENRCIQYVQKLHDLESNFNMLLQALRHVFPYATYRKLRPDLSEFTEPQIVDHFVTHGIHEGINLQFSNMEAQLQMLEAERLSDTARLELLNEKSRNTAQQLELLKDLLTRVMVNP